MKVYLRGNFAEGNFGDDALLVANLLLLQGAGYEVLLDCPEVAYHDPRFSIKQAQPSDGAILYGGGTQFFTLPGAEVRESQRRNLATRLGRLAANPTRIVEILSTRLRNGRLATLPHAGIGLGVGPFAPGDRNEEASTAILRKMKLLWVRDRASFAFCTDHGLTHPLLSTDLCFTKRFRAFVAAAEPTRQPPSQPRLGIVLRRHPRLDPAFHNKMNEVIKALRFEAIEVEVVSFSQTYDNHCDFYDRLGVPVLQWDPAHHRVDAFAQRLGEYSMLLTARYHGGIFGILFGRPFVTIIIEPKLETLKEIFNPETGASLTPEASAADYLATIKRSLSALQRLEENARRSLAAQAAVAEIGERALEEFLGDFETRS